MNNPISSYPSFANRQQNPQDYQAAVFQRESSLSISEKQETGLTIRTREGDLVTLNTSSYLNVDAHLYDSGGRVYSQDGQAVFREQQQEIQLASGQSFTFSVEGELSDQERRDISALLQGLDQVFQEMKEGDTQGALEQAMGLDGYASISSFTADLSYQRTTAYQASYAQASNQQYGPVPAGQVEPLQVPGTAEAEIRSGRGNRLIGLMERLVERLAKSQQHLLEKASRPIEKLLQQQLKSLEKTDERHQQVLLPDLIAAIESLKSLQPVDAAEKQ